MHRLTYRPDIDGLRAIAVLGVLFFHAGLGCQGGFVGVDVFFVISGFLITSLILRDLREGTFSFVDFWARRIRRIVPALAVMILAVIVAGYYLLLPKEYEILGNQIISLILCCSNIKFWRENGYFCDASDLKPTLHTWSLSVEEQFYFIIPIALFLLFRFQHKKFALPLIVMTCVISFATSVYASIHHPTANFYLLPTRAWELGVGSLLAFAGPIKNPKLREFSSFIGLTLIIGCYFLFPEGVSFPGASALPPVLGAALLIWSGIGQDHLPTINRLLTLKQIVGIGLISYSLYLWHWPIIVFFRWHTLGLPLVGITPFYVLLSSTTCGYLSWKYVEKPFRTRDLRKQKVDMRLFLLPLVILITGTSIALSFSAGAPYRINQEKRDKIADLKESNTMSTSTTIESTVANQPVLRLGNANAKPNFMLLGDSHAKMLEKSLNDLCYNKNLCFFSLAKAGPKGKLLANKDIDRNRQIVEFIETSDITDVLIAARWTWYFGNGSDFPPEAEEVVVSELRELLTSIKRAGKRVTLLSEVPCQPYGDIYNSIVTQAYIKRRLEDLPRISLAEHRNFNSTNDRILNSLQTRILDPAKTCFNDNDTSIVHMNGMPLYWDDDHLNNWGVKNLLTDLFENWLSEL